MPDDALRTLRVITFSRPLPVVAAQRLGFFTREGLAVEYTQTAGSVEQIRQLLAGQWDLAHTNVDNVMAYVDAESADLFVFLVLELGIGQKLLLRPGVSSYNELRGQTLGVDALATGYAFVLRKMLAFNGLADGDYGLISVGGTAQRATALIEGHIAAALLSPPHDDRAARAGCTVLEPASRYLPEYPGVTAAATRRWERGNEQALTRYVRGLFAGERWAADPAHRDQGIALLAEDRGVDAARAAAQHDLEASDRSRAVPKLREVEQAIRGVGRLRREMTGRQDEPLDLSRYWEPKYMLAADPTLAV